MSEIKILIQGYVEEKQGYEFASSTTTLIKDKELNIIVDPGMNREKLLESLQQNNLTIHDIDYVILTHSHPDHALLAGIFNQASVLDNNSIYHWDGKIEEHGGKVPGMNIDIIQTPGHDMFHCSVLVNTEEFGKVAIVGDVFWWDSFEKQETDMASLIKHKDLYVKNQKELISSRKKILKIANYVVPGHGKMFEVKK